MSEKEIIASRSNARLKFVRKVRDGNAPGLMFIEGRRLALEAVGSGIEIEDCFLSERAEGEVRREFSVARGAREVSISVVKDAIFSSIADTASSQGVILIGRVPKPPTLASMPDEQGLAVYLSETSNPSNLGAILRSAEAAGASVAITSPGSADVYSPKALRASMGSAFRLPVIQGVGFLDAVAEARRRGFKIYAAGAGNGVLYTEAPFSNNMMLVFGSEAHGITEEIREQIDAIVTIPMSSRVESLNLAVSAGILLFEAKRQRELF